MKNVARRLARFWNRMIVALLCALAGSAATSGFLMLEHEAVIDTGENGTVEFCGGNEFILKVKPAFEPRLHIICRRPSQHAVLLRAQYPWQQVNGAKIINTSVYWSDVEVDASRLLKTWIKEGGAVTEVDRSYSPTSPKGTKIQISYP